MEAKKEINLKLLNELAKYKRYCKCGHSMIITPTAKHNKIMCTYCGAWIYKNNFEEFKDKLKKKLK